MNRRNFIKITTLFSGGLVFFHALPVGSSKHSFYEPICFQPHPLLKLCDDGSIIIFVRRQEIGQGVDTSLPMIVAEELDAEWSQVKSEIAPFDYTVGNEYTTVSSNSVQSNWNPMRVAGATARVMLIEAAAQLWNIESSLCTTKSSRVFNSITNESIAYKDLISVASELPVPQNPVLKNYKEFKIVGQSRRRLNAKEIVTGKTKFSIDFKLPGMVYALILRCPVRNGHLISYDAEIAKRSVGVKQIVEIKAMPSAKVRSGIAVVADSFWNAQQALNKIDVKWESGEYGNLSSSDYFAKLKANLEEEPLHIVDKKGNPEDVYKTATTRSELLFEYPFLAHAPLEPPNCTATYNNGKFEVWGGFQVPAYATDVLAGLFNVSSNDIPLNLMLMGGGFGRRISFENAAEAMQIAKSTGKPVKVYWTREDDMKYSAYRPANVTRISASLDSNNHISSWMDYKSGSVVFNDVFNTMSDGTIALESIGGGGGDFYYNTPNFKSVFQHVNPPLVSQFWRSVGYSYNNFSVETMIDELAVKAKFDPLDFRIHLLSHLDVSELHTKIFGGSVYAYSPERLITLLKKVAEEIGWHQHKANGHFYGIACCPYLSSKSYAAHAFDISVDNNKKITIHRVIAGIDCGLVINPDGVKGQMEGSIAWALSAALRGEITFENGIVQQSTLSDYGVLQFNEMPDITVCIMDSEDEPGGAGEIGVPSVAPALCNAIYSATNYRITKLPISKEGFSI